MSKEAAMQAAVSAGAAEPTQQQQVTTTPETQPSQQSEKFAGLARKEAEFVKKQLAFQQERAAWEKDQKAKADAILAKANEFETTRKSDPIAALRMLGFTETEIFNYLAASEKKELTPEEKAAQAAQAIVDEKLGAFEKAQAEKEQQAQLQLDQKTISKFKGQLGSVIEANKDKYEYCAHFGAAALDLAYQMVLETVKESNGEDVPTPEEAIEMVEQYYEEEDKAMANIKKRNADQLKAEVSPQTQPSERTRTVSPPADARAAPATQTNARRTVANREASASTPSGRETPAQKRERLIRQLAGLQRRTA